MENPLSLTRTLSSMKNLDNFIFGDQFIADKSPEDEPRNANMETEVESMVTVPILQASSYVPPVSTPIINLSPPKPVSSPVQTPTVTATTATTITTLPLPPHPQQQRTTKPELAARVLSLKKRYAEEQDTKKHNSESCTSSSTRDRFRDLPEIDMKEILHQRMFESGSYRSHPEHASLYEALERSMDCDNREELLNEKAKSCKRRRDNQDPPPPPKDSDQSKKKKQDSDATDVPIPDDVHVSDSEDTGDAHLLKIKTRPDCLKPVLEEERPKTPKPDWTVPLNEQIGKSKLRKADLEGPAFKVDLVNPKGHRVVPDVSKPLPLGVPPGQVTIQPQYFFNKDLEYLVSSDKERRNALSISKLKSAYYTDFGLEELVPSLWIKSEREYDISAAYGITHWWFKRKEFYITRHSAPSDRRAVRSHMRILSIVSLKTYSRYGYTYLRDIILRRADYKEYKILESDFKNLHLNDFKDMYLLHLQGKLNQLSGSDKVHLFNTVNLWIRNIVIRKRMEDLQLDIKSYQTKLKLTKPRWDATDFIFKEDYTIVSKLRAVIYKDMTNQKKMIRESEVHKFSDGTLQRILEKLDVMVNDYVVFKFNPGMEHRIWTEDDKRRSQEFIKVIESRLKIRRIFRKLESFISGRLRDIDYKLIQRTE
ncbi:hypothetical protein Tco_0495917 [Tanacetum coccineum]